VVATGKKPAIYKLFQANSIDKNTNNVSKLLADILSPRMSNNDEK